MNRSYIKKGAYIYGYMVVNASWMLKANTCRESVFTMNLGHSMVRRRVHVQSTVFAVPSGSFSGS